MNSPAVIANAWHHRSDALSSVATLTGIGLAYFLGEKWRILDPVAAIFVGILILRVAFKLLKPALEELMERSLPREEEKRILEIIANEFPVARSSNFKTRHRTQYYPISPLDGFDGMNPAILQLTNRGL